jgi:predicted DNA-binding transcriptional regulator YafY
MFNDKPQNIVFYASPSIIDDVIDWFGYDIKIQESGEKYKITAKVSQLAMEYWALQYLNAVEIVSPVELRQKIKQDLVDALKKYEN